MSIHCFNCANNPQSQICLQCFLNGDHHDHDYIILPNSTGNCDCGDLSLWKRTGFCQKHQGEEDDSHPENYIDEKLRSILTEKVFKAIFISLKKLQTAKDKKIKPIFQFLTSFLKFGDGFRRLISITLIEKVDFENFLNRIFESSSEFNKLFQQLCSGLITDNLFKVNISRIVYKMIVNQIIPKEIDVINSKIDDSNFNVWNSFWFHCFSPKPIEYNVTEFKWNWVSFTIQFATEMKEFFALKGLVDFGLNFPNYFNEITNNIPIASQIEPNEPTQKLFDELFSNVLNCGTKDGLKSGENDTIIVTSFVEEHEKSFYRAPFLFNKTFYDILRCFLSKEDLKLDKLLVELNNTIDLSPIYDLFDENENNKFISKYVKLSTQKNENYIKSFHDGTTFFFSFPLFDSFAFLFRLDKLCRIKIAQLLSNEKYQSLRIQLGIVTIKKLLSFVCYHQSLVSSNNISLNKFLAYSAKSSNSILYGIPYYLPLLQLFLGLNDDFSLKEFFSFEIAREIGLFDDFDSESYSDDEDLTDKQTQMIFSFLYISILAVVERTLFKFDGYKFIEEQIILALKQGISNLDELNKAYDKEANKFTSNKQCFNKILSKVATTDRHLNKEGNEDGNDSSFYLKEGIKWNSISGINLFNNQKVILNNEISENPNKLIKIQDFEPEEKFFDKINLHLKDLLFTPTVLAVVYQTLRCKETGFPEVELNDHLALNILALISNFVKDDDEKASINESIEINYDSTLADLISKLKENVFKYVVDSNGNATIQNTLNNFKSFNSFLRIKIGSNKFEPKSFIDLILEKDQLGKNALKRMSIDINKKDDKKIESKKPEEFNKKQVNKLKEKIINQFQNDIDNYRLNNLDLVDQLSSSNVFDNICSVCSTAKENQILSYPIYIYRTKFPFIIDKPPLTKINQLEEFSVDDERDDEPDNELDEDLLSQEEEDEEEEAPDLPRMISKLNEIDDHEEDELQSQIYSIMFDPDLLNRESRFLRKQRRKVLLEEKKEREEIKKTKEEEMLKLNDKKTGKIEVEKRCTAGNNFAIQFGICQHLVHPECVNKESFKCPMDRSLKNGFLPAIDGLHKKVIFKNLDDKSKTQVNSKNLSDEFKESLFLFVDNFASFFFKPKVDVFVELVKSISGLIATYEVRLRSLPDCLDSKKTKFLSRNLFLTTWYAYRSCGKPKMTMIDKEEIDVESRLTIFQRFIKKLIEFDDLHSISNKGYKENGSFKKFVASFSNFFTETDSTTKSKEILLFLRRVCLSDFFLLNNSVTFKKVEDHFIDWDEIFSPSNLAQRYGIEFKKLVEFEFKPFVFSKLPSEFLRFEDKPFNFPIEKTSKFTLFCILDYNSLIDHYDDFGDSRKDDDFEFQMNQKNVHFLQFDNEELNFHLLFKHARRVYPTVWLFVGKAASKVVLTNMGKIGVLKPFYLDSFGCSDIGFKRGKPLYLNEERYERTMDEILSGDFSHYLPL